MRKSRGFSLWSIILCVMAALLPVQKSRRTNQKPNILVIFGDDIGQTNISAYSFGVMKYRTPNIDHIAHEGMMSTRQGPGV